MVTRLGEYVLIDRGCIVIVPRIAIPSAQEHQELPNKRSSLGSQRIGFVDTDDDEEEDIIFLAGEEEVQNQETSSGLPDHDTLTDFRPGKLNLSELPQLALPSYATPVGQRTIQKELQKLQKIQSATPLHELGWYIDFDKINNMYQWIVELHSFDPSLPLAKDMKTAGVTSIILEIRFLRGYPMTPPFVRVISPRFLPFTRGGGGHVTGGGAMCMELLTNTGWSPANSMESVLIQVRLAMCCEGAHPARLEIRQLHFPTNPYSITEAVDAYTRAANLHGWEVPAELKEATMLI